MPTTPPSAARQWGRSLVAVIVGVVIDLGGTNVAALCVSLGIIVPMMLTAAQQGQSPAQTQAQLTDALQANPLASALLTGLGLLCSLAGGYAAGWIAGRAEVLHGLAAGIGVSLTSVALSVCMYFALSVPISTGSRTGLSFVWGVLVSLAINWGATTLGGLLRYGYVRWRRRAAR
jgi:hypothetical protein